MAVLVTVSAASTATANGIDRNAMCKGLLRLYPADHWQIVMLDTPWVVDCGTDTAKPPMVWPMTLNTAEWFATTTEQRHVIPDDGTEH